MKTAGKKDQIGTMQKKWEKAVALSEDKGLREERIAPKEGRRVGPLGERRKGSRGRRGKRTGLGKRRGGTQGCEAS